MILKRSALLLALALFATPALACLWDDDTLAQEATGIEDEVSIILGGFPRNPDKYYEMRLEAAEAAIKADPNDFNAYDNAGVASDRLGKSDQAIAFMEAKEKALIAANYAASKREQPTQIYRLKANLGTFYVHRWIKNGRDFSKLEDVTKAKELIAAAIEENPDAHFGREIYQLKAINWLLAVQEVKPSFSKYHSPESYYPDMMGLSLIERAKHDDPEAIAKQDKELDAMLRGLTGLMQMGAAWRSLDVLYCMKSIAALQTKTSLAIVIDERMKELSAAGMSLMISDEPTADEAKTGVKRRWRMRDSHYMVRQKVDDLYKAAREKVEAWHKARTDYLEAGFKRGEHPDTKADFWQDFKAGKPEGISVDLGLKSSADREAHDKLKDGEKKGDDSSPSDSNGPVKKARSGPSEGQPQGEGEWGDTHKEEEKAKEQKQKD